ncbi:hypothetical protein HID58_067169 [Brassica napus]|uniref:Uncharacterized protein n=1 Tax=Brassica napus TaxID=3708 RepID=A0ABQ7ZIA3_BRANA|nr:hypothetical protein HID58_067169 [Brassica napus]
MYAQHSHLNFKDFIFSATSTPRHGIPRLLMSSLSRLRLISGGPNAIDSLHCLYSCIDHQHQRAFSCCSDKNMVLNSIQSSNAGESQGILSGSDPKLSQTRKKACHLHMKHKSLRILVAELLQQRISSSEILMVAFLSHLDFTLSLAPLPDKPASQMAKTISKMESDTGLAVDSNRAIGIELMEQVTERVIWTAMDQATEITMTGGCVRAYKVSVIGGMKVVVEEADMTA